MILSRAPFALVLSDIQMQGLRGIELLRKIVEQSKGRFFNRDWSEN